MTAFDPTAEGGVLVSLPHPDDESFSAGGTLSLASDAGVPATYLCGTYGDMGRRMGNPPMANRESLRDIRTSEMAAAAEVLGIEVEFMGLRDKCVEFEDPAELGARIREVIGRLRPSTVITFVPGLGVHPDHDAMGQATVLAVRGMPQAGRPTLLGVAVGGENNPQWEKGSGSLNGRQVKVDIRPVFRRKIAALKAHHSQTVVVFSQWDKTWDIETLQARPGAPEPDEQTLAWRRRLTEEEQFYVLDPDARTLLDPEPTA